MTFRRTGRAGEQGSAALELVVLMPLLLLILLAGIQGAVYFHARTLAIAAAQEGVRAAATPQATIATGQRAAETFLTHTAGDSLSGITITGTRTATTATITVRGVSLSLIPGWTPRVEQTATLPVERITR